MSLLTKTRYYRASCRCGWNSAWATSPEWAHVEAESHQDYVHDHLTFVNWADR